MPQRLSHEGSHASSDQEVSTEQPIQRRIKEVNRFLARGIDSSRAIGIHGTSAHTLIRYIETGQFPGTEYDDGKRAKKGDIFFYYLKSRFPGDKSRELQNASLEGAIKVARGYSESIARSYELLSRLNLLDTTEEIKSEARDAFLALYFYQKFPTSEWLNGFHRDTQNLVRAADISADDLIQICIELNSLQGFLLAISDSVLMDGVPRKGDDGTDRVVNVIGKPLGFFCCGIMSLGDEDTSLLNKMISDIKVSSD